MPNSTSTGVGATVSGLRIRLRPVSWYCDCGAGVLDAQGWLVGMNDDFYGEQSQAVPALMVTGLRFISPRSPSR